MNLHDFLTSIGFFAKYPYTDFHEMNLDWAITEIARLRVEFDDFAHVNSLKYAGEWDITKSYSAFSVVDDQGFGYMALKPVPPGTQINDTEYWLMVVDYSQITLDYENRISALETTVGDASSGLVKDVDDLQTDMTNAQGDIGNLQSDVGALQNTVGDASSGLVKDVDDLQSDMTNAQSDIAALQAAIDSRERKIIFMSDSYGYHPSNISSWIDQAISILNLPTGKYYKWYEGSMGFIHAGGGGHTFKTLAQANSSLVADKDSITDIVVVCGVNDAYYISDYTLAQLETAIDNYCAYMHATYPKAKLHLGMGGNWIGKDADQSEALYRLANIYETSVIKYDGEYITNIEYVLHNYAWFDDAQHPNLDGAIELGKCVAAHINGAPYIVRYTQNGAFGGYGTHSINANNKYMAITENGTTTIRLTGNMFTLNPGGSAFSNVRVMTYNPHTFGCPNVDYLTFDGVLSQNFQDPVPCWYTFEIMDPDASDGGVVKLSTSASTVNVTTGAMPTMLRTIPTTLF